MTRLLGQSPAGLSATGDSDTRNYYDMIAARQELDLRPQLERLDAVLLRSAGVDPAALRFAFRPLWQLSAAEKAQVALSKAQTSAVYAGLNLWPAAVTGALVRSQLMEDAVYPGAEAAFALNGTAAANAIDPYWAQSAVADFSPDQLRDPDGRWSAGGSGITPPNRAVSEPAEQAGSAPPQRGSEQESDSHDPEAQLLSAALNPLLLPLAARKAVLSVLQ